MVGDKSNFLASKSRKNFRKMQIFLRTKGNLGICPAQGIQEPRWPRASKDLCTPLVISEKTVILLSTMFSFLFNNFIYWSTPFIY